MMVNLLPILKKNYILKANKNVETINVTVFSKTRIDNYYLIQHNTDSLQVLYYKKKSFSSENIENSSPEVVFTAKTSKGISLLLQYHHFVFLSLSSSHALYLGRELIKAEIALIMAQTYIQD